MTRFNPDTHHRRSIRLKDYDYSQAGAYFMTVCAKDRRCIFGDIEDGIVRLSEIGAIAHESWVKIPKHFENVLLDEFVVMPNHIHGIIFIGNVGVQYIEPLQTGHLQNKYQHIIPKSIGSIVRTYKGAVTRQYNSGDKEYFQWQRNYYEHVIRNEGELNRIRQYIIENPLKWELDEENPVNAR